MILNLLMVGVTTSVVTLTEQHCTMHRRSHCTGRGAQGPVPVPVQRAQLPLQQALRRGRLRLPLQSRVRRPEARLRHGLRARLARGQLHLRVQITHLRLRTLSGTGTTTILIYTYTQYIL